MSLEFAVYKYEQCKNNLQIIVNITSRRSLSVFQHRRAAAEGDQRPETAQVGNMLEIGTRKIFNSDHDILRHSLRKFFKEEIVPHHAE